mmetsp:Transcript_48855/g.126778  ORF Transcript_48855/g.126778 Transcript_48855/m.126778 type:complete len:195 (-) Transcript_48855:51-635(-)
MNPWAVALLVASAAGPRARAWSVGKSRQVACPMDYDVPLPGGKPSPLHISSVANFLEPTVQDRWWTEQRVEQFFSPSDPRPYRIGKSKIAGCGVIATRHIANGTRIGAVWVEDPRSKEAGPFARLIPRHFTPWFGRAVNHCNVPDSHLEEDDQGTVFTVASRDIEPGEEVTGDYNEAARQFPRLVEPAPAGWTC